MCFLQGRYGAGKKTVAQAMCKEGGVPLLTVDIAALINEEVDFEDTISRIFTEAMLQDSAVFLEHFERLFSEDAKNIFYKNITFKALEDGPGITFIASEEALIPGGAWQNNLFKIAIPIPDFGLRKTIWVQCLNGKFGDSEVSAFANKFKFTAGQIKDAIASAEKLAVLEEREDILMEDLYDGCRAQSNQKLSALAERIKPKYRWDDLILPKEKKEQLKEVKNYIKNKGVVYHDRYANIEISYLLQKMEENEGIVILATNLSQNIDDAFMRRMHFNVEFPFPEEEYRYKIWKSMFPEEAPVSEDIEFEFLAKRFKLAGGNIKNIIVNAAFLAAEESGAIRMEHVIKAAKREFQKMGKVCSQSDFGK